METHINMAFFEITPSVTLETWFARMCRSGSAMEMINPKTIPDIATIQILFDFAIP